MAKIRAVILDFDGVLAESNEEKSAAFEELFALYPEYSEAMRAFHLDHYSSSRYDKFAYYAEVLMGSSAASLVVDEMAAQYARLVIDRVIACPSVPGAVDFLREFSAVVPLYISSATPQEELRTIVARRGIDRYITIAFGNPPTTKAAAISNVLEREGLGPDKVVFVGDSASDYEAAAEADLVFLGRDSGRPFSGLDVELHADLNGVSTALRKLI